MQSPRLLLIFVTLTIFILYLLFLFSGVNGAPATFIGPGALSSDIPNFSRYVSLQTLSPEQFPFDDTNRRVIIVGDIHGMFEPFQQLLHKVSYDPSSDVLLSVGDIVTRGPHSGSMNVLDFMTEYNITAVRGNHDQEVVEWRTWLDWVHSFPGGTRWLYAAQERWKKAKKRGADNIEKWVAEQVRQDKKHSKWWKNIPNGRSLFGGHYKIAESMTQEQYVYMLQRPLRIHIPHAHTFIVHAGMLASDPNYKPGDNRQPLAHVPILPKNELHRDDEEKTATLRRLQELAILNDVPQNLIPWNTLNMRGVLDDHTITRMKDGTPWMKLYNKDMNRCDGFDSTKKSALPCYPSTVVYGHTAGRGLDVNRWTIGLDTGCARNRRMTALVLGGKLARKFSDNSEYDLDNEAIDVEHDKVKFGDNSHGRIYSVSCK